MHSAVKVGVGDSTGEAVGAGDGIAVIGMAGRFPGARDLDEFWRNLCEGREAASVFTDEELRAARVPEELIGDPRLVRRRPVLEDVDRFDAAFFGYTPREAEIIDPQHRLFLETCWEALESAGYDPARHDGAVGVFGGCGPESYFLNNLHANPAYLNEVGRFPAQIGTDKDFLTPRVSYKLDLRGPSFTVLTGCSASLVAVHVAAQSLLSGESDMALAGGSNIFFPQRAGYIYKEGSVTAPDGRVRAFDAGAHGTVPGEAVATVLLKRLEDAVADGDTVLGVIRGSAVNNDGAAKAGFTAPSAEGQADVIAEAMAVAGTEPESIDYVETHGTGTRLGDAIEVAGLTRAFGTDRRESCRIGSLKPNIGHTDTAAGTAGLIKVLLALRHGALPPSINCDRPDPRIDFDSGPFRVNTELTLWKRGEHPRRAGISSFSVGGTNAHAVVEEAPAPPEPEPARDWQLLCLSARTPGALGTHAVNLAAHLRSTPVDLADAAFTLQEGRARFTRRAAVVARDREGAARALEAVRPDGDPAGEAPGLALLFPGQGAQFPAMAAGLYRGEPDFRKAFDDCAAAVRSAGGPDPAATLYGADPADTDLLRRTDVAQPALFAVEYALARLLGAWGLRPAAMLGHSVGEFAAACLAGVVDLQGAARLVAERGRLMREHAAGAMAAVAAPEEDVAAVLADLDAPGEIGMAAVNGRGQVVVSGAEWALARAVERLEADGVRTRRLETAGAFHSPLMGEAAERFAEVAAGVALAPPEAPVASGVTGRWITAEEAVDPAYWGRQMRAPVRFADGVDTLGERASVLLEAGPGRALSGLAAAHTAGRSAAAPCLPAVDGRAEDAEALLGAVGRAWERGCAVDWEALHGGPRRRVPLPTYPFERESYWVDPAPLPEGATAAPAPSQNRGAGDGAVPAGHDRPGLDTAYEAPRTPVEEAVAAAWCAVMGLERVGVHDGFFELGGHSLLAAQVTARLKDAFPVDLAAGELLEPPQTVAGMAAVVEERLREALESMTDEEAARLLADER
ncbi:type I polyketide synthase [Nocardiopsis baichengensis]|uniref:type I polyketide synthase n=1 Tax=Nocardiopsis baichengensis TaxID=280240 RepID=UPI00034A0977|nr:type I polyketide synthase [Nocardiopsis baichengensis]